MRKTQKKEEILYGDIRDKVKSFEDACQFLGIDSKHLPVVDNLPEKDQNAIVAFYKLTIITRALNEGWEPDFNDWDQRKYLLWLFGGAADYGSICGLSASLATYVFSAASSHFGARLLFKSRELVTYSWDQFKELWLDYLLINKTGQ